MKRHDYRSNAYFDQLRQKKHLLNSKRKISELIIDQLEDDCSSSSAPIQNVKSTKQPCIETSSIEEIDDDYEELERKPAANKPPVPKVSLDEILTQATNKSQNVRARQHRRLLIECFEGDNDEIDESSPNLNNETAARLNSMKPKPLYDIDEILDDDETSRPRRKIIPIQSVAKREKLDPLVIEETNLSEFELNTTNRNVNKSGSKKPAKKSVDIDSFLSLSLEEEEEEEEENRVAEKTIIHVKKEEEEEIVSDVSQALTAHATRRKALSKSTHHYDIENLLSSEDVKDDNDGDESSLDEWNKTTTVNKKSGTEWLKELNERLANASAVYLNGDVSTDAKKTTTSPPSLLTVNTSNMYLNESEIKKRKAKFIKNGFAEKLQKLLIRQASSINFVKHCMNKKSNEQSQFRNVPNIIKTIPIYKQSSIVGHNFYLIHALLINDRDRIIEYGIKREDYVYLLISQEKFDMNKYFEKSSFAKPNIQINIYPPWRKMLQKNCNQSIYFCADLVEVTELELDYSNLKITTSRSREPTTSVDQLTCPQCSNLSDCNLVLFDTNAFVRSMSIRQRHHNLVKSNPSFTIFSNSQSNHQQNYLFQTQNDSDYYHKNNNNKTNGQSATEARSQYLVLNSILDALDNVGYYGFVTFRACVQRVSSIIEPNSSSSSSSSATFHTQKTQTTTQQLTPLKTTQFTQNYSHKRELIVSDKCGMFALIWLPLESSSTRENCDLMESNKYQFNSFKFIEKQSLSERDHPILYEQMKFLWHEMNRSREERGKPQVKSFQRIIYVFEFVSSSRSSLDFLGPSNSYLPLNGYYSLKIAQSHSTLNITSYFFDLNDVVLLKLIKSTTDKTAHLYYIDKTSAYSSTSLSISVLELNSLDQIRTSRILEALEKNTIIYKLADHVVCLKNMLIRNSDIDIVHSNLYSSIVTINRSGLSEKLAYSVYNEENLLRRFINELFVDLSQRRGGERFVKIEGSLLHACDENSALAIYCHRCSKNRPKEVFSIGIDSINRSMYCENCGSVCENKSVEIEVQLSLYLNCIGVYHSVRVNLHPNTISTLISWDKFKRSFVSKSRRDFQSNVLFDYFANPLNKPIGPLLCFLTFSDDTRIDAQELILS